MAAVGELWDGSFLDRLDDEQRAALFASGTKRRYPAGSTLFFIGEDAHEVLVLLDGEVKAIVPAVDGRLVILAVRGPGDLLGEMAAVDGGVRSATIEVIDATEVLAVRVDDFDELLDAHPRILRHLVNVIAGRLRASNRRQLEFGTGDSMGRLCARLVELAERYGETDEDGHIRVASPLSQADLGSLSGMSREAVVKSLRSLRSLGWIRNEGRIIVLVDLDSLRGRSAH